MRLTKMGHACVRLEKDGRTLVIDPGTLTEAQALEGADGVLITHEHPDHVEGGRIAALVERRPDVEILTTAGVAEHLDGTGARVHVVGEGDEIDAAGFQVRVYGRLHALVNPAWPRVANVGFLVDGTLFHPGDAFTVPDASVASLLLPTHAPWLKAPELIDYVGEVAPVRAYSIHDGFLNEAGLQLVDRLLASVAEARGADVRRLAPGERVDLL